MILYVSIWIENLIIYCIINNNPYLMFLFEIYFYKLFIHFFDLLEKQLISRFNSFKKIILEIIKINLKIEEF